jgi:hypothetical protein
MTHGPGDPLDDPYVAPDPPDRVDVTRTHTTTTTGTTARDEKRRGLPLGVVVALTALGVLALLVFLLWLNSVTVRFFLPADEIVKPPASNSLTDHTPTASAAAPASSSSSAPATSSSSAPATSTSAPAASVPAAGANCVSQPSAHKPNVIVTLRTESNGQPALDAAKAYAGKTVNTMLLYGADTNAGDVVIQETANACAGLASIPEIDDALAKYGLASGMTTYLKQIGAKSPQAIAISMHYNGGTYTPAQVTRRANFVHLTLGADTKVMCLLDNPGTAEGLKAYKGCDIHAIDFLPNGKYPAAGYRDIGNFVRTVDGSSATVGVMACGCEGRGTPTQSDLRNYVETSGPLGSVLLYSESPGGADDLDLQIKYAATAAQYGKAA